MDCYTRRGKIAKSGFEPQILRLMPSTDSTDAAFANPDAELDARAKALANPASGLANDYLNIFNEIIMLVENYPAMPEFGPDILAWRPVRYGEHYRRSNLPGRIAALEAYARVDEGPRRAFDAILAEIAELARQAADHVRERGQHPAICDAVAQSCRDIGTAMAACLSRATYIVNHGSVLPRDNPQERIDKPLQRRTTLARRRGDAA